MMVSREGMKGAGGGSLASVPMMQLRTATSLAPARAEEGYLGSDVVNGDMGYTGEGNGRGRTRRGVERRHRSRHRGDAARKSAPRARRSASRRVRRTRSPSRSPPEKYDGHKRGRDEDKPASAHVDDGAALPLSTASSRPAANGGSGAGCRSASVRGSRSGHDHHSSSREGDAARDRRRSRSDSGAGERPSRRPRRGSRHSSPEQASGAEARDVTVDQSRSWQTLLTSSSLASGFSPAVVRAAFNARGDAVIRDLSEFAKKFLVAPAGEMRDFLARQLKSAGVEYSTVRLRDPLTMGRIELPTRTRLCKHEAVFDLASHLSYMCSSSGAEKPWVCPICGADAVFGNLLIDGAWMDILDGVGAGAEEVRIASDGSLTLCAPHGDAAAASDSDGSEDFSVPSRNREDVMTSIADAVARSRRLRRDTARMPRNGAALSAVDVGARPEVPPPATLSERAPLHFENAAQTARAALLPVAPVSTLTAGIPPQQGASAAMRAGGDAVSMVEQAKADPTLSVLRATGRVAEWSAACLVRRLAVEPHPGSAANSLSIRRADRSYKIVEGWRGSDTTLGGLVGLQLRGRQIASTALGLDDDDVVVEGAAPYAMALGDWLRGLPTRRSQPRVAAPRTTGRRDEVPPRGTGISGPSSLLGDPYTHGKHRGLLGATPHTLRAADATAAHRSGTGAGAGLGDPATDGRWSPAGSEISQASGVISEFSSGSEHSIGGMYSPASV